MSNVYVRCPSVGCKKILAVPDACRGAVVTCHFCRRLIRVPLAKAAPTPASAMTA
jgi:hypothetical protein